jgi:hypothetical protein
VRHEASPPLLAVWLLGIVQGVVPLSAREDWRSLWTARLENLWVLAARGEFIGNAPSETVRLCRDACKIAFRLRFQQKSVLQWVRGPGFVLAVEGVSFVILALLSRGFQATRSVIRTAIDWWSDPTHLAHDARAELLVAHFVPILLAFTVGAVLMAIGRLSVGRYGWRYWLYLISKLGAVMWIVPLVWIEGNAALRAHLAVRTLSLLFGWLAWTLAFLGAFGCAIVWVFTDQRRRCPECLRRLALPVTLGSWASIFDPVTTEMLCDEGHGSLCMDESEIGAGDRWIALDSSWKGL